MATPNQATPAATPAAPVAVDAKAQAKGPEVPPSPAPAETKPEASAVAKPVNQLEADLAAQLGEDWEKLSPKSRERMIAAEMKSREADKRMQLAAKLKKDLEMTNAQVAQLFDALKRDPWKVLSNPALGHDVRKMAEEYVWQMIQEQRMTPEQREAMQAKMELQEMKSQQEAQRREQSDREMQALIAQRRAHWEKSISEAIDTAKLPKTSYTVRRFAEYIRAASKARIPADMPAIATQIRQELVDLQSKFLLPERGENETADAYEERIIASAPSDYVKALRKADLRKLRAKGALPKPGPKPTVGSPRATPQQQPPKMSMSEWLSKRDERLGR